MADFEKTQKLYLDYNFEREWSDDPYYESVKEKILSSNFIFEIDELVDGFMTSKGVDLSKPEHLYLIEDINPIFFGLDYVFYSSEFLENFEFQLDIYNLSFTSMHSSYCFIKDTNLKDLYRIKVCFRK